LHTAYAADGFLSQYSKQTQAWATVIPQLKEQFTKLLKICKDSKSWTVVLEYPLYRLRKRIDVVVLTNNLIVVIESKVGSEDFSTQDRRQVEEYALDLRDFHHASKPHQIVPILWSTSAKELTNSYPEYTSSASQVTSLICIGAQGLAERLAMLNSTRVSPSLVAEDWDILRA
jgi:hypothetical protein